MSVTFSFNGRTFSGMEILRGESRGILPDIRTNSFDIPRRNGAVLGDRALQPRVLTIPFILRYESISQIQTLKRELASFLYTKEAAPIIFSDEPTIQYFGVLASSSELEEYPLFATGVLVFVCHDPLKYSTSLRTVATNSFSYSGSAPVAPILSVILQNPVSALVLTNGEGEMFRMVGDFSAGTEIVIDTARRLVLINGVPRMDTVDFQSRWPKIYPGLNTFESSQPGLVIQFRERWY